MKEWLKEELSGIRTGRATPGLIEKVHVEVYGVRQPIKQIASISIEDAKTLRIAPWDKGQIGPIQNAIEKENLGVSCAPDDAGLRVIFPMMTEENRKKMAKLIGEKLEEARVSLRKEREKIWEDIQEKEKNSEISKDDKFRFKDDLQKFVDEYNKELADLALKKEKEILET